MVTVHFNGYINSKKSTIWSAETHMRCMKVLSIRQNWCLVRSVSKTNCGTIVL